MRIYFDENFSPALAAGMRAFQDGRKGEDVEVCSIETEFGRGIDDEVWIPGIARTVQIFELGHTGRDF
jgi:hypothetical protein